MTHSTVYLVAMDDEIKGVFDIEEYQKTREHGFTTYQHTQAGTVIIETGIGKSNAAAAAQYALQFFPAQKYLNLGLVGAVNHELKPAEVIAVEKCGFFDVDVTAFNYEPGQLPGTKKATYLLTVPEITKDFKKVSLVSGDTFLQKLELRNQIIKTFQPDVIDMELASIAHIFDRHQKLSLLSSIKAVSDYADSESNTDFYIQMTQALAALRKVLHAK